MKVYIVIKAVYDSFVSEEIKGVFKTKESAENYIYKYNDNNIVFDDDCYIHNEDIDIYFFIEEYEVKE